MLFPPINPPPPTVIDGIGNIMLLVAGIVVFLFMVSYGFFFSWRKTPGGKAVMYFVIGLVALLGHFIVSRFAGGDYPFRDVIRLVVYTFVAATASGLLWNLWATWARGNHSSTILPWRERVLRTQRRHAEAKEVRVRHRTERRALRWRQRKERWRSEDDDAVQDASEAHQDAEERSSSSSTSG